MTHVRLQIKAEGDRVEGQILDVFTDADAAQRHLESRSLGRGDNQSGLNRYPFGILDRAHFVCVTLDGNLPTATIKAIREKTVTYRVDWRTEIIGKNRNISIKGGKFRAKDVEDVRRRIDVDQDIPISAVVEV